MFKIGDKVKLGPTYGYTDIKDHYLYQVFSANKVYEILDVVDETLTLKMTEEEMEKLFEKCHNTNTGWIASRFILAERKPLLISDLLND